jgi:hypothetical protein
MICCIVLAYFQSFTNVASQKNTAKERFKNDFRIGWTLLKVHKHEIFLNTFFAETESLWSQGPVTRDF